jgi:ferric-dicitrate binding protein FerR (iron transport regulator)
MENEKPGNENIGNENIEEIIRRFILGTATDDETDMLAEWKRENPVEGQRMLDREYKLCVMDIMNSPAERRSGIRGLRFFVRRHKIGRYAAAVAASLLVGFATNHLLSLQKLNRIAEVATTIEAPAGQHIRFTLGDGSVVDLNSGSSISYPTAFTGRERRVKLTGEAMFDVAADAKNPFIVETFACEVTALGTRFNVIADEAENDFSTALLEGKVAVNRLGSEEKLILEPDMIACLHDGRLVSGQIKRRDDYLWPEGVISVGGLPFDELAEKLEKAYGVRIVLARPSPPEIKYTRIKIRTSEGVAHAMEILSAASDFTYEYDEAENVVTIK